METEELSFLSVAKLGNLLRNREISPVELVEQYLGRIERFDSELHSYITVCSDEALDTSRKAREEIAQGKYRGPLHGVPIAIKDQICTKDIRTTGGSLVFKNWIPEYDATVSQKLKEAGAILLGKLNLSEFALGGTKVFPYGMPRNPWNTKYTPGESSSGSGIAVASGLCSVALGEDTGGSVRGPASCCGIVGLRPTTGRVSRYGMLPLSWSMDTAGPMTRNVEDSALLLNTIAGYDPKDPTSIDVPVPEYTAALRDDLKGMRIGYIREFLEGNACHSEVSRAIEQSKDVFRGLGASVQEVSVPLVSLVAQTIACVLETGLAGALEDIARTRSRELDTNTRTRYLAALLAPSYIYQRGQKARNLIAQQLLEKLKEVEVLVSPTLADPPREIAFSTPISESEANVVERMDRLRSITGTYSLARLPAISIPCGFSSNGLPIGLQIGGMPFAEDTLLRVAYAFESATEFHLKRPPVS